MLTATGREWADGGTRVNDNAAARDGGVAELRERPLRHGEERRFAVEAHDFGGGTGTLGEEVEDPEGPQPRSRTRSAVTPRRSRSVEASVRCRAVWASSRWRSASSTPNE
jgi:hypothetical protein